MYWEETGDSRSGGMFDTLICLFYLMDVNGLDSITGLKWLGLMDG